MELKKYRLGEIADIVNGATPPTKDTENYDGNIIWITPKDLSDQKTKWIRRGQRNITKKGFNNCSAQMIPPHNILMSSRAPIGLLAINENECCTNQGFKNLVLDKTICDTDYIYYYLKFHIKEIEALGSGTTFKEVSKSSLYKFEISLPNLETQRDISKCLSDLDRKIELNKQINDNLEAMAKQLYDYWFVQFDFPNEEGKPYKSSGGAMVWNEKLKREIPTSFDVKSLSEIIEVKDGTHDSPKPQDNGYFLLTSKHLTERGLDYASAYKISKEEYESINKRSKVDTNDILFSMIGTIGNSYFVEETNINFAIKNMALFKTSAKRWFSGYLYLYLSSCDYKHYEGNSLSGSIQKFVSLRTLRDMPILYHEDIIKVFAKEVRNIITMMVNLRKENIELTKQLDELLPLLMNGQASVNYHLSDD